MKGKITVVGLGPGNLEYLSRVGERKIREAEIVIAGERQLEDISELLTTQTRYRLKKFDEMKRFIFDNLTKNIVVVVSGDTGYYSLLEYIKREMELEVEAIAGISSFQYLFARLGICWNGYELVSLHGRECDFITKLKESEKGIIILTDKKNSPSVIAEKVVKSGVKDIEVIVGERLSYFDEKINCFKAEEYLENIRDYDINITVLRKV